jgi:hypothetical protein
MGKDVGHSQLKRLWEELATQCNESLQQTSTGIFIAEEPFEIPAEMVFDASSYWRDWLRTR